MMLEFIFGDFSVVVHPIWVVMKGHQDQGEATADKCDVWSTKNYNKES